MIADALGVTKAAVDYQFKSKNDIILAVAETGLERLDASIGAAEAEEGDLRAREVLLTQIDLAVQRRRLVGVLQTDPVMVRFLADHDAYAQMIPNDGALVDGFEWCERRHRHARRGGDDIGGHQWRRSSSAGDRPRR
ncbi:MULTISPECIES: TetR/AcrR family transcriptional regulator [unclassified Nocardia]|uniref:TetR/AcrR family transcriptional regulator n=1 Tax=unclassified Nocardia TaxID=2637762 RepID=UPI0034291EA2